MRQGDRLSEQQRQRIIVLLRDTELTMDQIGQRFDVNGATIASINKAMGVRQYRTRRGIEWEVEGKGVDPSPYIRD